MAAQASKTSIPIPERHRPRRAAVRVPTLRLGPGPATMAVASVLCLLIGLLYLALQIRMVFSDQIKQEYASLVLEEIERADSARHLADVWEHVPVDSEARAEGRRNARAELARRLTSLAALVNASPSAAPRIAPAAPAAPAALSPDANLRDTDALLRNASAYWHAQRDIDSADVRVRITHVAYTVIALAALLFCMLITALGMYAKRTRQLAGQSQEFEHAALHDPMTGLPNRRKLFAALEAAAMRRQAESATHKIAVLYVDLDGFKQVNDSLGHRVGDEFLVAVSKCFRGSVRKADVVARIGGDEFAVLVRGFSTDAELVEIAGRLIACVVRTDEQMGIGLVRASIGIASFPDLVDDYRRLIGAADEAMYQVKRSGKNGYAFVDQGRRAATL
ncbi:diguanylate cyclase [Paraburkholderia sp. 22099]|jgi:diguanylate cyclase (GGDEF)-like protein|uniref:Diguanylate cyclase (GGDEF) domain-containing protein n=1 Tax=Paraburkholderia terricola TaxID=169427 RepID=A0A1M6MX41_9BURK|nr:MULTISPECIES: GGDEF domain-containing protein [Paraburkholderia]ORC52536.1 GGDEF domain-containing protein [Burkholderia sp. A27]MDR6448984.1 diguanylate cyclase (GGDEF)-like protein [Paraburkholderia terricola]MDR6495095.1 diguanylate cyclase (GGDEF)-like protein [Paraburkholderia terricola]SDO02663.1 diguanylate cyclase (GGDEF) domain-containing protein [Paraburkholderia sediminicola]SHJ87989.1 diguanylate cyclase (GGDEF) domain-containing protein [Paraburkholderia terricola]